MRLDIVEIAAYNKKTVSFQKRFFLFHSMVMVEISGIEPLTS